MHFVTQSVVVVASLVIVAAGVLYIGHHVDCINAFGFIKSCTAK